MLQRQRRDAQRAQRTALEGGERLAEIEDTRVLVEIGEARGIVRAVYRNAQPGAPAQLQQTLGVVGVVVRLQDAAEATGDEALAEIGQAAVEQPALAGAFDQCAARTAAIGRFAPGAGAGRAAAVVHRQLRGIAGAEQGQPHRRCSSSSCSRRSTLLVSEAELSRRM